MRIVLFVLLLIGLTATGASAQTDKLNFHDRQAVVINNAPQFIQLSDFSFRNTYSQSRFRLNTDLAWKNVSSKPIVAFEVVMLRYDPFNRPLSSGGRWLITGRNSGDWSPLMPGQSSNDGMVGFDAEPVLTSIVYVRAIRFADGDVWMFDRASVEKQIRQKLPVLKELGEINPPVGEPKK